MRFFVLRIKFVSIQIRTVQVQRLLLPDIIPILSNPCYFLYIFYIVPFIGSSYHKIRENATFQPCFHTNKTKGGIPDHKRLNSLFSQFINGKGAIEMSKPSWKRFLSLVLSLSLMTGIALPVSAEPAADSLSHLTDVPFQQTDNNTVTATPSQDVPPQALAEQEEHSPTETVRVSVVLEEQPTMQVFSSGNCSADRQAVTYRQQLEARQEELTDRIEKSIGTQLEVVWNLTLAANAISANVKYGDIEAIEEVPGVAQVVLETRHEPHTVEPDEEPPADPLMAGSTHMTGSTQAWQSGYTGSGMRIAIIDTGLDTDHQSVDPEALEYALRENAQRLGKDYETYLRDIQVETEAELAEKLPQLNMAKRNPQYDAADLYLNLKTPFAYNYIDKDLDVTHDVDHDSDHGSHVAGISAANRYIHKDGGFVNAANAVGVVGNAPDAQLFVMKVFGKRGGAYDSDYMAAIEDAIVLGCDSVNLSLGSTSPGMSTNPWYQKILDSLTASDTVVSISAGNSSRWSNAASHGKLYVDGGVNFHMVSSPGSYTNAFTVASANNEPTMGKGFEVGGNIIAYAESLYSNAVFSSLDKSADQSGTVYPYIMLDSYGRAEDFDSIDVTGKIVLCSRGAFAFHEKANNAAARGALAVIIYNNEPGIFTMNLDGYKHTAPVVSISQEGADRIRKASAETHESKGGITYHTGTLDINHKSEGTVNEDMFFRISGFSSWGVPGTMILKPEITAPGGNIYSLSGSGRATDQYQFMSGTSMAAPQIAGITALVKEYIEDQGLSQSGLSDRALAQSLMMSTAVPMKKDAGSYFPVIQQGAGLVNAAAATSADSFILVDGQPDGKVKAELMDDPQKTGRCSFTFRLHNFTDMERSYQLSADLFTQKTDGTYLDTRTGGLDAELAWSADGTAQDKVEGLEHYDFNGDGKVNRQDAEALLEYVNGARASISSADWADISGDGKVSTYDVHKLLNLIDGEALTVPAKGTVTVQVDLTLTAAQKKALDEAYPTGAYVEGFVFLKALSDAEGYVGTSHSIPLLGYYGNWSDASMFDNGTYQTHKAGVEPRDPYMGNTFINTFSITYQDIPYTSMFFGGNPVLNDKGYFPERNAINTERGDRITSVTTSPIRNAGAFRVTMENDTTGEILYQAGAVKEMRGAYYYGGLGGWNGSTRKTAIDWTPEGLREGEALTCRYTLAPEMYVGPNKQVRWDDLGRGASISITAAVDNTSPVLESVQLDEEAHKLHVRARDNRYVAGVLLYNMAGDTVLSSAVAGKDAQLNQSSDFVLDTSKFNGSKFLIQVVDYARNILTYELELPIGDGRVQLPMFVAYHTQQKHWAKFDTDTSLGYMVDKFADSTYNFRAGTMAGKRILVSTDKGSLYAFSEEDFSALEHLADLNAVIHDMAYNPSDGLIYGVTADNQLVTLDSMTGDMTPVAQIGVSTGTLACDREGTFYCAEENTSKVYSFTVLTAEDPVLLLDAKLSAPSEGIQSMEVDLDTNRLYWVGHYEYKSLDGTYSDHAPFLQIDLNKHTAEELGDLWYEMSALLIQSKYATENHIVPAEAKPVEVQPAVDDGAMTLQAVTSKENHLTEDTDAPQAVEPDSDCGAGTVSLTLTADQLTTNGRIHVAFDPQTLRYVSGSGAAQVNSIHPTEDGIDVAYAYKNPAAPDSILAELVFTVQSGSEARFEVTVLEDNTDTPNRTETVTVPTPVHQFKDVVVAPTCTQSGYTNHICRSCGYSFKDTFVKELGHNWGEWTVKVPATNQKEGVEIRTCSRCGEVQSRAIPKTDHNYKATVVPPTCTEPGYTLYTCEDCGDSCRDNEIPALGHNWGEWTVKIPATNQKEGVEIRTCTRCGETESRTIPKTECEDHQYESSVVEPTCTHPGYTLHTCTICGYSYKDSEVPALGHSWGEWKTEKPATCKQKGLETHTCTRCGETESRAIPKLAHSYEKSVTEPTCTKGGYTVYTCTACGHSYRGDEVPALGHSWGEWKTEKPATCKQKGLETHTCTRCGETESRTIPKTDHHYEPIVTPPTCTESGYTTYTCTMCGRSYTADRVPALGHSWGDWTVEIPATCQKQGKKVRSCTHCGETQSRIIPKGAHNYETQVIAPICSEEGYTIYTCTICGHKYRDDTVPAKGHSWGEWTVDKPATCKQTGVQTHTCTDCGVVEFQEIPMTQHNFVETTVNPASCETPGFTMKHCTICGHKCISHSTPALGHQWSQWTVVQSPTCKIEGWEEHICTHCGKHEGHILPKLEHNYTVKVVEPTCTSGGYTIYTCTDCGHQKVSRVRPPLEHSWGSWHEVDGVMCHTCTTCGLTAEAGRSKALPPVDGVWELSASAAVLSEKGLLDCIEPTFS